MVAAMRSWWNDIERWYVAVGLANLVLGTSSVLIPLTIDKVYGLSVQWVGVLTSLVSLVGVLGSLVWGRLSDAANRRKPFIVLGYAVVGACFLLVSFTRSFNQLAVLNMVLNFFWVANASVTVLLVVENRSKRSWETRISQLNQFGAFGWVLGLALGGLWMQWVPELFGEVAAIRALYGVIGALGILAAVLVIRMIPRTTPRFTQRRFRGSLLALGNFISEKARFAPLHLYHRLQPWRVLQQLRQPEGFRPGTRRLLLSTLVSFVGLGFFGIPLPLLLSQQFGLPSSSVFVFFLLQQVGIALAYPLASRRIRKFGNRYVHMTSLWVRVILFGVFATYLAFFRAAPATILLVAGFVLYGITWSYFQLSGIALTSRLASEQNRGLALGLYNAIAGVGWILAGLGGGLLAEHAGYAVTFAASCGLLALSLVILLFVPDPTPVEKPQTAADARHPDRTGVELPDPDTAVDIRAPRRSEQPGILSWIPRFKPVR